jgi:hypothetical protein
MRATHFRDFHKRQAPSNQLGSRSVGIVDAREIEELQRLAEENRKAFERAKQLLEGMRALTAKEAKQSVKSESSETPEDTTQVSSHV